MTTSTPATVVVSEGYQSTRLRALHAAYPAAKAAADDAAANLRALTDALKIELTEAVIGAERIVLPAAGDAPALRLARTETWRLDTARLKREQLATYVAYAKKSESWVLRAVSGGDDE